MTVVGIDVSKEKSTVAILRHDGRFCNKPFVVEHCKSKFKELTALLSGLHDEVKIVMEATGIYHLPILQHLQGAGFFVAVINPLVLKRWRTQNLRMVKTDKQDGATIAHYGYEKWFCLQNFSMDSKVYQDFKLLGRHYAHYMEIHISALQGLNHLVDQTLPGIKKFFQSTNNVNGKNKFADFVEQYWHHDNITRFSEEEFIADYNSWARQKGYLQSAEKAKAVYAQAIEVIPLLDSGKITQFLVSQAVEVIRQIDLALNQILSRMTQLAKILPEYDVVKEMSGVGEKLAARLIAEEIGDIRRLRGAKSLVTCAGIDSPPYQSGKFTGENRRISKRGSALLRKIGYEVMLCVKAHKPKTDFAVYNFIVKKESEGKAKRVAKIAGLNKFLHIYYARVKEVCT